MPQPLKIKSCNVAHLFFYFKIKKGEMRIFVLMQRSLKITAVLFAFLFILGGMVSCKSKGAYNKYRSAKVRPSEKQMRADKKIIAKSNKNYKKNLLSNRKRLFGNKRDPKAPRN